LRTLSQALFLLLGFFNSFLATAYYDARYADFVSQNTGAKVVNMAHQAGARPGTEEYLIMMDYNVRQLTAALQGIQ
jgi:ABC-type Zn uptake system ZnuABC Zn-binding protein ZnuA